MLKRRLWAKIGTAVAVGVVVFAAAYASAWRNWGASFAHDRQITVWGLRNARDQIAKHCVKNGTPPATLAELEPDAPAFKDGWGCPLVYTPGGAGYELLSHGADGRPGGSGLDADLYGDRRDDEEWLPTLSEFMFLLPTQGVLPISAGAGVVAGIVTLILLLRPPKPGDGRVAPVVAVGITMLMCVAFAGVIVVIHYVSGH